MAFKDDDRYFQNSQAVQALRCKLRCVAQITPRVGSLLLEGTWNCILCVQKQPFRLTSAKRTVRLFQGPHSRGGRLEVRHVKEPLKYCMMLLRNKEVRDKNFLLAVKPQFSIINVRRLSCFPLNIFNCAKPKSLSQNENKPVFAAPFGFELHCPSLAQSPCVRCKNKNNPTFKVGRAKQNSGKRPIKLLKPHWRVQSLDFILSLRMYVRTNIYTWKWSRSSHEKKHLLR